MQNGNLMNRFNSEPIPVVRSMRRDRKRILTTGDAGKIIPLAMIPMLRMDGLKHTQMSFGAFMRETDEPILNNVSFKVCAYFVPNLAFERFKGSMEALNRSFSGEEEADGNVIDYIKTKSAVAGDLTAEFYKSLGMHFKVGDEINQAYLEAYNLVCNYRQKNLSKNLTEREVTDLTLASAHWINNQMMGIKPDFDQSLIDGEVSLSDLAGIRLPVHGIQHTQAGEGSLHSSQLQGSHVTKFYDVNGEIINSAMQGIGVTGGNILHDPDYLETNDDSLEGRFLRTTSTSSTDRHLTATRLRDGTLKIFAELDSLSLKLSLSNIEYAKKTMAFAQMRQHYQGFDDEYIIDLLMQGIDIPDQQLKNPILLANQTTQFGFNQRYATDSGNLDKSASEGFAQATLSMRFPKQTTGGVIVVTGEIVPEQLFERQKDYYLYATSVDDFPNYLNDVLDLEPVSVVKNSHVDVDHTTPDGLFGYARLNHEWERDAPNIGGEYYRPSVTATFSSIRQKIWANEEVDPQLSDSFYLTKDINKKIFSDRTSNSFELEARGIFNIEGLTHKGGAIIEASDDFEKVQEDVDTSRISKS